MRKLKPCPFCGSEGVRGGVGVTHHTQCKNRKCPAYAGSYHKTREDSDDVWNKRVLPLSGTLPDDPLDLVVRLREKLRPYAGLPDDFEQPIPGEEIREIANWLITEADRMINSHTTEK